MKIEEWKQNASPEAIEQYDQPIDWFKANVKCCYNCKNWEVSPELMFEYRYNFCTRLCKGGKVYMTAADGWCKSYQGNCTIENLLDYMEVKDETD